MFKYEDQDNYIYTPPLFFVLIPKKWEDDPVTSGIKVFSTNFFVPTGTDINEKRGIANIDFSNTQGKEDKEVTLRVYVTKEEKSKDDEEDKTVSVWKFNNKTDDWEDLGGGITNDFPIAGWAGHIDVNIRIGDPPIAVG